MARKLVLVIWEWNKLLKLKRFTKIVLALQASCRSQDFCKLAKLVNKNYCSCDSQILLADLLTLSGANVRFAYFRVQIIKKRIRF